MRVTRSAVWYAATSLMLMGWTAAAPAADVLPPSMQERGRGERPSTPVRPDSESTIDPGIQRRPPTQPHPESVVPPPDVDPSMTVDPETAPPAQPGGNQAAPPQLRGTPR